MSRNGLLIPGEGSRVVTEWKHADESWVAKFLRESRARPEGVSVIGPDFPSSLGSRANRAPQRRQEEKL